MRNPVYDAMDIYDSLNPDIFSFFEWPTSTNADVNNTTANPTGRCNTMLIGGTSIERWTDGAAGQARALA